MSYSVFSTRISDYLAKELQQTDEKKEIMAYAVENIINTIIGFIVIMTLGFILKAPLETFWAAMAGGLLRKLSGGFHCSTPARCIVTGAITYALTGMLTKYAFKAWGTAIYFVPSLVIAGIVCLVIVVIYAPVDSKAKPIVSIHFKRKLRMSSIISVVVFILIAFLNLDSGMAPAVFGGLAVQSFSLLPVLNKE